MFIIYNGMLIKLYHINIIRDMIPVYYKPESQGNTSYTLTIPPECVND